MIGFAHRAKGGAVLGASRGDGPFGVAGPSHPAGVRLVPRSITHPDAQALVHALYAREMDLRGFADHPETIEPRDYEPPAGLFVLVYHGTVPIGCGGWRTLPGRTAQITHLYIDAEHRGRGHGRHLLGTLERTATEAGARRLIVETGNPDIGALADIGYTPCDPYSRGRDPAVDAAMIKPLFRALGARPLSAPPQ
ncbi:GNAT family N-acetyltransferase (plasmid) [Embleya sp. NBC_00888]|uniref:GNAT family N-acetyltransferase n=1 Tax=Embleya sp. NBC_00888 TaxID=2975960 RepID=UPI002F909D3D|nr:GNAT family N-acetyltransferase [Embleya sp. NBC_00888]